MASSPQNPGMAQSKAVEQVESREKGERSRWRKKKNSGRMRQERKKHRDTEKRVGPDQREQGGKKWGKEDCG